MDNLPVARFQKLNEQFTCLHCQADVPLHPSSSRDHCHNCLWGLHVDINPGDRANECRGELMPIGIELKNSNRRIIYNCTKCGTRIKNIAAPDDSIDKLIALSKLVWK
jgi:DNA-directed RNA polymerase subunit RPC12/RpoP